MKDQANARPCAFRLRHLVSLVIVLVVFGLIAVLVLAGYHPAVATATATTAGLIASTLLHQIADRGRPAPGEEER
jgi:hypothetical protein